MRRGSPGLRGPVGGGAKDGVLVWDGACLQAGAQKSIVSIIPQPLSAVKASMQVVSRYVFLTPESRSCTRSEELTNDVWFEVKGRRSSG